MSEQREHNDPIGGPPTEGVRQPEQPEPQETFQQLQRRIEDKSCQESERTELKKKRNQMIMVAAQAGLFDVAEVTLEPLFKKTAWDDLKDVMRQKAIELEKGAKADGFYEEHPEWRGMVKTAVEGELARTQYRFMLQLLKEESGVGSDWFELFNRKYGYGGLLEERQQISDAMEYRFIRDLLGTKTPENLVGTKVKREKEDTVREVVTTPESARAGSLEGTYFTSAELREEFRENEERCDIADINEFYETNRTIRRGIREPKEKEFWNLRIALFIARARKQIATEPNNLIPNNEIMNLTVGQLETLTSHSKVAEAVAIYAAIIKDPNIFEQLKGLLGINVPNPFKEKVRDHEFEDFRRSFRTYLQERFRISKEDSEDSERIGYNLIYMSNIIEEEDRMRVLELKYVINTSTRDIFRPKEKILQWIKSKRPWPPNVLGQWALNNRFLIRLRLKKVPLTEGPIIKSWFNDDGTIFEKGKNPLKSLPEAGRQLIQGSLDSVRISWSNAAHEMPLTGYYLYKVSQAILIFNTIYAGEIPQGKNWNSLITAFQYLGTIDKQTRRTIKYLVKSEKLGIKARSGNFGPGILSWIFNGPFWGGESTSFNQENPQYFK